MSIILAVHFLLAATATTPETGPESATKEAVVAPKDAPPARTYAPQGALIGAGLGFVGPIVFTLATCQDRTGMGMCALGAGFLSMLAILPGGILGYIIGSQIKVPASADTQGKAQPPAVSLYPAFDGRQKRFSLGLLVQF